ncbi:MAG: DUF1801 domain-containing protein [Caulobacter sp.]|nr:DUF1801 domain-containing protein [Caulobacter sp.]
MASPPFAEPGVEAVFAAFPEPARGRLLALRALIHETADGPLTETLKWGQPAWRPATGKAGTTVRVGMPKGVTDIVAIYVPCSTTLVETFRDLYGDLLRFEGKRAILIGETDQPPREALAHCIRLALTYRGR